MPATHTYGAIAAAATPTPAALHFSGSLAGVNDGDRLVMYLRMQFGQAGSSRGGGTNMIVERGNVKWLGGPDADALFSIPAGFTESK